MTTEQQAEAKAKVETVLNNLLAGQIALGAAVKALLEVKKPQDDSDDWTGALIDRLNELVRENRKYFEEVKNGSDASRLIQAVHGAFNGLRAENERLKAAMNAYSNDEILAKTDVQKAEAEVARLRATNAKLVEGLRPFAKFAQVMDAVLVNEGEPSTACITPDDLRRAAALVKEAEGV